MKQLHVVVLVKQVPDTRNVGKDAMKPDGTVNRGALPAIFNPDDLRALEQALRIKDAHRDVTITLLTMGPPRAVEVLKEGIYRGADRAVLLTDRAFAGADTLATSYALALALKKLNPDFVLCGLQAIDGDTAQVGPQVAQKLGWPQITYANSVELVEEDNVYHVNVSRRFEWGSDQAICPLPCVVAVSEAGASCRPRKAKRLMAYKRAEAQPWGTDGAVICEMNAALLDADEQQLGLAGSPTKVKSIQNVAFQVKEAKQFDPTDEGVDGLVRELLDLHILG